MILSSLHIQAFRSMTDVHLEQLAPVTLLVGANNSGKSSVLEAAALLMRPFDPGNWVQVARQRGIDISLVDGLWSLFPFDVPLQVEDGPKQTNPMRIQGKLANGDARDLTSVGLASENWDAEASGDLILRIFSKVDSFEHEMVFRQGIPAQFGGQVFHYKCFMAMPATHRSNRYFVENLSRVIDDGNKSLAIEMLKIFDPQVQGLDVSARRGRDAVRITHATRGVVDLASFGDGMWRAAFLALTLMQARGGVLLIDELESGIHPKALGRVLSLLFDAARNFDVQVLATTHSLETVDAMVQASLAASQPTSLYYLQRTEAGHMVKYYDQERILTFRKHGYDLR